MSETFNPYRQWLGIEHCPRPSFYQLLGLAAGESDAHKIVTAADRATTKIQSLDPGGQAPARSQLLAEIQSAKSCLLDPVKRAEYDQALKGKPSAAPSNSNSQAKSAPSAPGRPKALPRAKLLVPNIPQATPNPANGAPAQQLPQKDEQAPQLPLGVAAAMLPGSSQPASSVPAYPSSWQTPALPPNYPGTVPAAFPAGPFPSPTGGPQADPMLPYTPHYGVPALGTAPAYGSPGSSPVPPQSGAIEMIQKPVVSRVAAALAARRRQDTMNLLLLGGGSVVLIVGALIVYAAQKPAQLPPDRPELEAIPAVVENPIAIPPEDPPSVPVAQTPVAAPGPGLPMPIPTDPLTQPEPEPREPMQPEPVVKLSKEQLMDLGQALANAKTALGKQDFDRASAEISRAELLAGHSEHKAMTARLKEVAGYVKQFHDALVLAVQNFQAGEEIMVGGSTVVSVVETGPDKIVVRVTAQNRMYRLADLPVGLALAIVDYRLSADDPVNGVIRGAYLAVDKRQDPDTLAKAKNMWERALTNGVEIGHLMPFLTDDYQLGSDK